MRCGCAKRCAEQAFRRPARRLMLAARAVSDLVHSQYARSACSRVPPSPNVVCVPLKCALAVCSAVLLYAIVADTPRDRLGDVCTSTVLDAACFCECQCMPTLAVVEPALCLPSSLHDATRVRAGSNELARVPTLLPGPHRASEWTDTPTRPQQGRARSCCCTPPLRTIEGE